MYKTTEEALKDGSGGKSPETIPQLQRRKVNVIRKLLRFADRFIDSKLGFLQVEALHAYNEAKDEAHVWLERLASIRRVTISSLYKEFNVKEVRKVKTVYNDFFG